MTIETFPVAFLFFAGALVLMLLPQGKARGLLSLIIPLIAAWQVWNLPMGNHVQLSFMGIETELMRVDRLARVFGLIFSLMAFLGNLYAWHVRDAVQQVAALLYAGAAIGAVFAGDLITLFFYWEGTAIASVFLIWARRTTGAYHTGMRYLIIQIGSGVILLAGAALFWRETGSLEFNRMTLGSPGTWLIFLSFGIKAAFPFLHNWLQDSYPAATVTGAVILSAFTTKLAIYALARGFAGTEILIYIGAIMTVFPIFFAEIENDLRRVLAYSLNNQLGFMVVGIGIGTEMALNGTAAHAFAHILYKSLLFMSIGAVLYRTGTSKASELGGLYRTMPRTAIFCLVGAAAISAFPLLSGFVTKSLVIDETASAHYKWVWAALVFASAGVLSHSGIKIPYFAFFGKDSGLRPREAPWNMQLAMGIAAAACIFIGVYPQALYALLPYEVHAQPYTMEHVVEQMQLLLFALLVFALFMRFGWHPKDKRAVVLDTDWTYRRLAPNVLAWAGIQTASIWGGAVRFTQASQNKAVRWIQFQMDPNARINKSWPTGTMVLLLALMLGITLVVAYAN